MNFKSRRCQRTGSKQQRISGQEGCDHESGFHEDDEKKQCICPATILGDDLAQVDINMQENIDKFKKNFHVGIQVLGCKRADYTLVSNSGFACLRKFRFMNMRTNNIIMDWIDKPETTTG